MIKKRNHFLPKPLRLLNLRNLCAFRKHKRVIKLRSIMQQVTVLQTIAQPDNHNLRVRRIGRAQLHIIVHVRRLALPGLRRRQIFRDSVFLFQVGKEGLEQYCFVGVGDLVALVGDLRPIEG